MRRHIPTALIAVLLSGGASACATKGYVRTNIDERARRVERRVTEVERAVDDSTKETGRNTARITEVDDTASGARATARSAVESSRAAQATANDAQARAGALESAGRRLLFEVVLSEEHGRFAAGDASLPRASSKKLDELVLQLRHQSTTAYIEIEGHTDANGPAQLNRRLELERAEAVRHYLHEHHRLPLHKMSVISYGEDQPIAPNETIEGRAMNRRVVVRVLG